jgi:hypothetical protein
MNTCQSNYAASAVPLSKTKTTGKRETSGSENRQEQIAAAYPCLIPEGEYLAFCTQTFLDRHSRAYGQKVYLYLKIFDGEQAGKVLIMFCRHSLFPTSRLYRAWAIANNGLPVSRKPRLDHRIFRGKLFRVSVRTVRPRHRITSPDGKARLGEYLPDYLNYSKVECLLSLEVTNLPLDSNPERRF